MSQTGTDIVNYTEQMKADAAKYAQQETVGGNFITLRGGIMMLGDDPLPGNMICAVILDSVFENTYYSERFDPNAIVPPTCYAFARGDDKGAIGPHPAMQEHPYFQPQHVVDGEVRGCHGCPKNFFRSADTGRGKACANRRRLAVMAAGFYEKKAGSRDFTPQIFTTPAHYQTADIVTLKVPTTSTKEYAKFVQAVASQHRLPPYGVVAEIRVEPDVKTQFKLRFDVLDQFPPDFHQILYQRHLEAMQGIIQPYAPPDETQQQGGGRQQSRFGNGNIGLHR